jgi:hypothetical protein
LRIKSTLIRLKRYLGIHCISISAIILADSQYSRQFLTGE